MEDVSRTQHNLAIHAPNHTNVGVLLNAGMVFVARPVRLVNLSTHLIGVNLVSLFSITTARQAVSSPNEWLQIHTTTGECDNNNQCTRAPLRHYKGQSCEFDEDCWQSGVYCSPGKICGGEMAQCERDQQSPSEIGESQACVSGKSSSSSSIPLAIKRHLD